MTTEIPDILRHERIFWQGVDSTTPPGCTLITAEVLGLATTYVLRDGNVLGRIETHGSGQAGYVGDRLKGGYYRGAGDATTLAQRIVDHREPSS
ncbi:hypothetical protein FHR83_006811 [Actinoplanes campanulatus]|uniref:Uncharacterized protein n=1 Tax=Actinoplanes campanulatus TaxID=113559 RepID=A0A7W5AMY5_9ACTN|nr:hypothetical protein [Actinoplanes campanulatus]MBB3099105.1 hypothetical protein [Actinoplanes campanulatus]GGN39030.1 hypothetical protein GCM10010109_66480 [Actinoplanes campanulatus]GID40261.1 hypothetical protein Aca09nite_67670 [Actinoplanes campanulatus]